MATLLRWIILEQANNVDFLRQQREANTQRRRTLASLRQNTKPFDLTEKQFIKMFRLSKSTTRQLIAELGPYLRGRRRSDGISKETKVLAALAFYATGSYQTLVGSSSFLNLSQISVSRSIREVTEALNEPTIFNRHVKWPNQQEERNDIKVKFYQKFGIPGVLGCIDGTQVAIVRPSVHEERYFNRKGYHSLNAMIICDSDLNILCIDPSTPGAAHDSRVWHSHPLYSFMNNLWDSGEHCYLLGDSGYPLRKTMMTPILDAEGGTPENYYYIKHVQARNTVERCIGVLKARFRCLLVARTLHYHPHVAGRIVNACCVLHNIANKTRAPLPQLTQQEVIAENQRLLRAEESLRAELESATIQENNRRVNIELSEGRAVRQTLVNKMWTDRTRNN